MENARIAYFSMEIGLESEIPTYSGGLGILAGDTLKAAADLRVPLVAVTLLHRKGYFRQTIDSEGNQGESPDEWSPEAVLAEMPPRVSVALEGRVVRLRCWKYDVTGQDGRHVPVYFLDSDLPENSRPDRSLTDHLYGGDERYRLCQEAILGIGGLRMLKALGYQNLNRFHMNEGHSSLLTLELLNERVRMMGKRKASQSDLAEVSKRCVFTSHTPVAAGHDRFSLELARQVLGEHTLFDTPNLCCYDGMLNLTFLALNLSRYVNGVARKHGEISRLMFAGYRVDSITNGVHVRTWCAEPFQDLFDQHIPGWRQDSSRLRYATGIPLEQIGTAHQECKRRLLEYVEREVGGGFDASAFTIGFARRATSYKRPDLFLQDISRLQRIASEHSPLQIIYSGKAHPRDTEGKNLIARIIQEGRSLGPSVRLAYLPDYGMEQGKLLTSGCDLWLNTPEPPLEASGTSGMKAALNGVPSLSILDGWWIEGHIEGITGWAIGSEDSPPGNPGRRDGDARSLLDKLEEVVLPLYRSERERYLTVMRYAIALNGSFFNAHRMIREYCHKAYR